MNKPYIARHLSPMLNIFAVDSLCCGDPHKKVLDVSAQKKQKLT